MPKPDDLYAARRRAEFETHTRVSGPTGASGYRYPGHLAVPAAMNYPPPSQPGLPMPDHGIEPGT
jgi:hypothetical protein